MSSDSLIMTKNGVQMSRIIYGTAWKKEQTARLVELAINAGFRGIDTACQPKHYFEAGVGAGITACVNKGIVDRDELYVQTKFTPLDGQETGRIPYNPDASLPEQVWESCQVSLNNLNTTYLDCLILHSPLESQQKTQEAWRAMERLVQEDKVKHLGISNCYDLKFLKTLYNVSNVKPAVIQNRFYAQTNYDLNIRAYCQDSGIIYQGFWILTANPHILMDAKMKTIAKEYNRSPAQIFFRYLTQIGITPLTGTTSIAHMREDLAIFEFELNLQECEVIKALL